MNTSVRSLDSKNEDRQALFFTVNVYFNPTSLACQTHFDVKSPN